MPVLRRIIPVHRKLLRKKRKRTRIDDAVHRRTQTGNAGRVTRRKRPAAHDGVHLACDAGRAALRSRGVAPELAFKVKGSPAVLSTAVRDRHRD